MRDRRVASGCGGHGAVSWRGKLAMREEQKVISAWAAFAWGKRSRLAMHVGRRKRGETSQALALGCLNSQPGLLVGSRERGLLASGPCGCSRMQKRTTLVAAGHATDWRKGLVGKGEAAN